jgi:hypothetical protein
VKLGGEGRERAVCDGCLALGNLIEASKSQSREGRERERRTHESVEDSGVGVRMVTGAVQDEHPGVQNVALQSTRLSVSLKEKGKGNNTCSRRRRRGNASQRCGAGWER